MKFAIISLLPLLAMASAIGERADDASVNGIPPNAVAQDDNKLSGLMTASEKGKADLTATCPPNYPKYCPAFNFCCPSRAIGCCQRACCLPGATHKRRGTDTINDDLEIVHVKNLPEDAKLDVALCVVAEGGCPRGATSRSRIRGAPARRRYEEGLALAMKSNMAEFVKMLYDLDEATKDAITQAEMLRQRAERMADWEGHVVSGIVIHNGAMPTHFVLVPFLKDPSYYVSGGHSPIAHYIKASKPYSFRATLAIGKTDPTLCGELQAILFLSSLAYQHDHTRGPRLPHGECSVKTRRHPVWSDHVKDANTQSSSAERATDMTGLVHTRRG
ncbi:hypothetical protein MY1884_007096 [Beauveria asiatica]